MKAVSDELYQVLLESSKIPELKNHFLVGGTNLALRFNHRVSVDVDLFTDRLVDRIKVNFQKKVRNRLLLNGVEHLFPIKQKR